MFEGRTRPPLPDLLTGYPVRLRHVIEWYDGLSDWQRVRYAVTMIVFLLACAGYLLGLGSTLLLQRVEAEEAALASQQLLVTPEPAVEPTADAAEVAAIVDLTPPPTATPRPPVTATNRPLATPTLFSAPVIAEKPAAPRVVPANPVPAPRAPVSSPPTPTPKPRIVENATPVRGTALPGTPTPSLARGTPAATVRATTTARTPGPTVAPTSLPTLRIPSAPTPTPSVPNKPQAPTPTPSTPAKTQTPTR